MPDSHCFGMFAKYWEPGRVKTRLADKIGETEAATVYRAFLETAVERYNDMAHPLLVFSPDDRESVFFQLVQFAGSRWSIAPQGDGDLGLRMHRFFERAFANGFGRATLIGSDSPSLPTSFIRQSETLLRWHKVVLGPSIDGGYYLVGARDNVPPIFSEISWSSSRVWQQTIDQLQKHRIRYAVLPTWYDVDTQADLNRLRKDLAASSFTSLQQKLDSILPSL